VCNVRAIKHPSTVAASARAPRPLNPARSDAAGRSRLPRARTAAAPGRRRSRRLYEEEAILQDVLAWARAQNHKWAYCRSVERLLKLIADFKKAKEGTSYILPYLQLPVLPGTKRLLVESRGLLRDGGN
jgi:hypothetical protein